jgi:hypothetical protein
MLEKIMETKFQNNHNKKIVTDNDQQLINI